MPHIELHSMMFHVYKALLGLTTFSASLAQLGANRSKPWHRKKCL